MAAAAANPPLVLVLVKSDGVGGVERLVATLVSVLEGAGAAAEVVALGPSTTTDGILGHHDVTVLDPRPRRGPLRRLLQLVALRTLQKERQPVAVVSFGPSQNSLACLARRRGTTTVIAEVGNPFIARRRRWNRWWMWTYRRADVLVVQTRRLAEEMQGLRSLPRRIEVIPNMLPPGVPVVAPDPQRNKVVAGVGRFDRIKRYDDLLRAFARLGPEADGWTLLLVGDGPERAPWGELAAELGLSDQVRMPGVHEAPWELLASTGVFVLCSEREGFPTVLVEAMASGCAVVASDCRFGPRDVLAPDPSAPHVGLLYPVGDVDALAAHLRDLMSDDDLRNRLAQEAGRRVLDFTAAAIAPQWATVIGLDRDGGTVEP